MPHKKIPIHARETGVLQTWATIGESVENLTSFGADLAKDADLLSPHVNAHFGYGWMDGGCLMFAQGLAQWSAGQLDVMAVCFRDSGETHQDHAVVRWTAPDTGEEIFLDAYGAMTSSDLIRRWEATYKRENVFIAPWVDDEEIPADARLSWIVAQHLQTQYGRFDGWVVFGEALDLMAQHATALSSAGANNETSKSKVLPVAGKTFRNVLR